MPGPVLRFVNRHRMLARCRNKGLSILLGPTTSRRRDTIVERLGSRYGGWIVPSSCVAEGSVCYLGGLGEDSSLDRELATRDCQVFVFDPTPRAIEHAKTAFVGLPNVQFMAVGLWSSLTVLRFFAPANPDHVSHSIVNLQATDKWFEAQNKPLTSIMRELGHGNIDFLKLDIEGAEFEVLLDILRSNIRPGGICVEFDQPVAMPTVLRMQWWLRRNGYRVIATEGWNVKLLADASPSDRDG